MKSLIILGENFINANDAITASSGAGVAYIYDQKRETMWESDGSSEGAEEILTIVFKNHSGITTSRTVDRLILLNTNLSKFYFQYWDGAAWQTITESVHGTGTENVDEDVYIEIATPVAATSIRLVMTNTIGAVAEKSVGEVKACLLMADLRHRADIERRDWDDGGSYRLQGGGLVSFQNARKYEASVKLYDMSLASYELIRAAVSDRLWMTWVLWEDFRRADIYEVMATDKPINTLDRKTQLYSLSFSIKER